jgi:hypothetical protein
LSIGFAVVFYLLYNWVCERDNSLRDLHGVLDRESAPIAVLISLEPPTKDMTTEAISSGYYNSPIWQRDFPRLQILTIEDLLNGYKPELPPSQSRLQRLGISLAINRPNSMKNETFVVLTFPKISTILHMPTQR